MTKFLTHESVGDIKYSDDHTMIVLLFLMFKLIWKLPNHKHFVRCLFCHYKLFIDWMKFGFCPATFSALLQNPDLFGLNLLESSSIFQFLGIFLVHSIPYQLWIFSFLCCCSTCGLRPTASASTSIVRHTESWNHGWRVESELTFYKLHQRFLYPEILRKTDATYSNHTVDWLPYGVDSGNGKLLTMSLLLLSFRASGLVACLYVYVLLTWLPPMSQSTLDSKPDMIHM